MKMVNRSELGNLLKILPPVDFCCVYGSTLHPNNRDKSSMVDYIIGVSEPQQWHSENMKMNADHYASIARLGGAKLVTKIADHIGAGIHFNPFVTWNDKMYKYGVVRMKDLVEDLTKWDNFYLSGRFQKPVQMIVDNEDIENLNSVNLRAATSAALLFLSDKCTEEDLYAKLCSLSYAGDLRMLFAEDKNKVKKIVQGQFDLFKTMYTPILEDFASKDLLRFTYSSHQLNITQNCSLTSSLLSHLPHTIRTEVVMKLGGEDKLEKKEAGTRLNEVLRHKVMVSSARQAVAGFLTVGPVNGVRYLAKKMQKAWKSRT